MFAIVSSVQLNMVLKVAFIQSGKDQDEIASLAKIHPTRLSQIVRRRVTPTESEKLRIAGVLQKPVDQLFSETPQAVSE